MSAKRENKMKREREKKLDENLLLSRRCHYATSWSSGSLAKGSFKNYPALKMGQNKGENRLIFFREERTVHRQEERKKKDRWTRRRRRRSGKRSSTEREQQQQAFFLNFIIAKAFTDISKRYTFNTHNPVHFYLPKFSRRVH